MDFEMLPIPEEIKEQIRKEMDENHMRLEAFRHDVQRLFEEIDKDHLVTLRHVFFQFAQTPNPQYAAYLEGVAATTLHYKYGVCGSCGEDHTEALLKEDGSPGSQPQPPVEVEGQLSLMDTLQADERSSFEEKCLEFGVEPLYQFGVPLDQTRVQCCNCKQIYVNLADRTVKPPGDENCPGCIHKAKWG